MGMLHDTAAQLTSSGITGLRRAALLESWALHLRNLIEFFHPTSATTKDTVRAAWYVEDPTRWTNALPALKPGEQRRRVALHKLLAHVSYLRDGRKSRWSGRDHRIVTKRLQLFHAHLSRERKKWFPRALK
jgi:alpha-D-ribose 1-methylphosphonate 5-triphosphate synthase subunit PhnH